MAGKRKEGYATDAVLASYISILDRSPDLQRACRSLRGGLEAPEVLLNKSVRQRILSNVTAHEAIEGD